MFTGDLTWYETGLGSCGISSGSSDAIVAISHSVFDDPALAGFTDLVATADPNSNPMCGKKVRIYGSTGTYEATVVDRCTGCVAGDLDLSHGFFQTVTGESDGRIGGTKWEYIS
ncbi:hypothetical protein K490DRAFT_44944 [Saccharata proteae CBS 121410]|uniref:Plant expansin n=1 Tax=Saccharata proteae CBS 121410 TaxID=1314787 RepID=A0A9P4HSU4_9PEZI|nr:hypothetical protein K490DRAFT_44944 [Saccharata proteae CBS 121410]